MLATKIKEDLISQGKIANKAALVTHDLLDYITELDMTGELVNDPQASFGIKYFKNLVLVASHPQKPVITESILETLSIPAARNLLRGVHS